MEYSTQLLSGFLRMLWQMLNKQSIKVTQSWELWS